MKSKILFAAFLTATILTLLVACGRSSDTTATTASSYTVSMGATSFNVNSITIPKGGTITFTTDQGGTAHNLVNGSSGQQHVEGGAPTFPSGGETVAPGQNWSTSPWTTAGTFHVTCTLHPTTMTLTVVVTG
ncbi:MAG TPA: plastocyanin/azurin family copper-binding protein [Ktedonobacteraceae bacterium]|nr:plastocyanin/azurin family copper-binding protein [Ktedonobacteraceae bacterium]